MTMGAIVMAMVFSSCDPPQPVPNLKTLPVVVAQLTGHPLTEAQQVLQEQQFIRYNEDWLSDYGYGNMQYGNMQYYKRDNEKIKLILSENDTIEMAFGRRCDNHQAEALRRYYFATSYAWKERLPNHGLWHAVISYGSDNDAYFMEGSDQDMPLTNETETIAQGRKEFETAIHAADAKFESIAETFYQSPLGLAGAKPHMKTTSPIEDAVFFKVVIPACINIRFFVEDGQYITEYGEQCKDGYYLAN